MTTLSIDTYLSAMRAEHIPAASSGLWFIEKRTYDEERSGIRNGKRVWVKPGTYTYLRVYTDSTLLSGGEIVMEDTIHELRTHLGFVMHASGRVLVAGLGLGCVIRGLLANPNVEHVTCLENSKDVLKMVQPYMPAERLTIVKADALEWSIQNKDHFDCGWYDLWTNRDEGEPHLDRWHTRLFVNLNRTVKRQGAWGYKRELKRAAVKHGLKWIG